MSTPAERLRDFRRMSRFVVDRRDGMLLDTHMTNTEQLIPTIWTIERMGRGLAFARSNQDTTVGVMLSGARGEWHATATPFRRSSDTGPIVHGPQVTGTTQQEACQNAWVALQMQRAGM